MNRLYLLLVKVLIVVLAIAGCSGSTENPVNPSSQSGSSPGLTLDNPTARGAGAHTHLWGYYDLYFDLGSKSIDAVPNRDVMYAANVVQILNSNLANLEINVNDTPVGDSWVDADFDVTLNHPLPGMPEYNGYDVRGIFVGTGSSALHYGNGLRIASPMYDQIMTNPDGYTRWFNPIEFGTSGVLGFTKGTFQTKNYNPNCVINPYKIFADELDVDDDVCEWLAANPDTRAVFTSGSFNTRNYYIHFPMPSPGANYGYAVLAAWEGEEEEYHPANAPEILACDVVDNFDEASADKVDLSIDFSFYGWGDLPSGVFVDSDAWYEPYDITEIMQAKAAGENYAMWHVDVPVAQTGPLGNGYWLIAEFDEYDYSNDYGVHNSAEDDTLASFFRFHTEIEEPLPGWAAGFADDTAFDVAVDGNGNTFVSGYDGYISKYAPDGEKEWTVFASNYRLQIGVDAAGYIYSNDNYFVSKFSPDGERIWGINEIESNVYGYDRAFAVDKYGNSYVGGQNLSIYNEEWEFTGSGGAFIISFDTDGNLRWARRVGGNYGGSYGPQGHAIAIADNGHVFMSGCFDGSKFDAGDGNAIISNGSRDAYVTAWDTDGTILWAQVVGGSYFDESRAIGADNQYVYLMGSFNSADFDPGDGSSIASKGWLDIFITAFDHEGNFAWTRRMGGTDEDRIWGGGASGNGTLAISGFFQSTNFDPGNGSTIGTMGYKDAFLIVFGSNGNYMWDRRIGSSNGTEWGYGVHITPGGEVYQAGQGGANINYAPTGSPCFESDFYMQGNFGYVVKYLPDGCW